MTEPAILEVTDVDLTYPDGTAALAGVSMALQPGEFVSVVGPSGCGKSTLLRLVSGLMAPTRGTTASAAASVGYVFQDATLLPWRTVRRNVALLAELHRTPGPGPERTAGRGRRRRTWRMPAAERTRRADAAIDRVGLTEFARHRPAALSGGMRMRASLARALTLQPDLFLLDEPFGALDELTRGRLGEQLQQLFAADGFAALLVTHSIAEAVFLSSRVLVMSPRPGAVLADVVVPFDYPRAPELRFDSAFAALAAEVAAWLRDDTVPGGVGALATGGTA